MQTKSEGVRIRIFGEYGLPDGGERIEGEYGLPDGGERIEGEYGLPDGGERNEGEYGLPDGGEFIEREYAGVCRESGEMILFSGAGIRDEDSDTQILGRLKKDGSSLEMSRRGAAQFRQVFEEGKRHEDLYRTDAGAFVVGTTVHEMAVDFLGERIHVRIDYTLDDGYNILGRNRVEMDIMKEQDRRELPVGVFDSGVGGVSVLREMVRLMPGEDFYFFGDSANAPYGTKSREQIRDLTLMHSERMRRRGIKALVIACNTATSAAIRDLREAYPDMPVIGIEPALKPAAMTGSHPKVLVMATPQTVAGEKFRHLVEGFADKAAIEALPCPGLMEFVERGELSGSRLETYLKDLLGPYLSGSRKPDSIVLGCTHYPFVRGMITGLMGDDIPVFDGSEGTARETRRRLEEASLLRSRSEGGEVIFEMSLPGKEKLARRLLLEKP